MTEFFTLLKTETILNNTITAYIYFLVFVFVSTIIFFSIITICGKRLKKSNLDPNSWPKTIFRFIKKHSLAIFCLLQISGLSWFLNFTDNLDLLIKRIGGILAIYIGIKVAFFIVDQTKIQLGQKLQTANDQLPQSLIIGSKITKTAIFIIALIALIANFGYNVNSLIAGLGIGGIAIAFAVQNILADIFSSFSIFLDQPFKIGDHIHVNGKEGKVRKIGLKTTRIELLEGPELVIANKKLSEAEIINEKQMRERRVQFKLSVTSNTSLEQLEKLPSILKNIIDNQENCRCHRVIFMEIGESFGFDIVYFVCSRKYMDYAIAQQKINLDILSKFATEKIELATKKGKN